MWIKICGIREVETALAVARSGADAIGLNFYEKSPRAVAPATAARIVAALPAGVEAVGVFVNHSIEEVRAICRQCRLQTVQLHGDEPAETLAALAGEFRVIRAFAIGNDGLNAMSRYLEATDRLGAAPWACLIDARVEGSYGGTGQPAPWQTLSREYKRSAWPRLILAGGLRPENVVEGVRTAGPWGVDVASGVESSVACKDMELVREFVLNAKRQTP